MTPTAYEPEDPDLDAAIGRLPRTMTPTGGYSERVLDALREQGILASAPPRAQRMRIAAAWFIAGVGTGAAALGLLRREPAPDSLILATSFAVATSTPAEPVEWY